MRKHDELNDPSSCLNRAAPDEIVFVVLGRDPAFAATVRRWAAERVRLGKNEPGDPEITGALALAEEVRGD